MSSLESEDLAFVTRLNDFFVAGENTDIIGNFFSQKHEILSKVFQDGFTTDSQLGLEVYALYKEYGQIVEGIVNAFIKNESVQGRSLTDGKVAKLILALVEDPAMSLQYVCVDYIAGQLEFEKFVDLASDMCDLMSAEWAELTEDEAEESEDDTV